MKKRIINWFAVIFISLCWVATAHQGTKTAVSPCGMQAAGIAKTAKPAKEGVVEMRTKLRFFRGTRGFQK